MSTDRKTTRWVDNLKSVPVQRIYNFVQWGIKTGIINFLSDLMVTSYLYHTSSCHNSTFLEDNFASIYRKKKQLT